VILSLLPSLRQHGTAVCNRCRVGDSTPVGNTSSAADAGDQLVDVVGPRRRTWHWGARCTRRDVSRGIPVPVPVLVPVPAPAPGGKGKRQPSSISHGIVTEPKAAGAEGGPDSGNPCLAGWGAGESRARLLARTRGGWTVGRRIDGRIAAATEFGKHKVSFAARG
jgi:hypothetical protein